jgi:hypothetical protein
MPVTSVAKKRKADDAVPPAVTQDGVDDSASAGTDIQHLAQPQREGEGSKRAHEGVLAPVIQALDAKDAEIAELKSRLNKEKEVTRDQVEQHKIQIEQHRNLIQCYLALNTEPLTTIGSESVDVARLVEAHPSHDNAVLDDLVYDQAHQVHWQGLRETSLAAIKTSRKQVKCEAHKTVGCDACSSYATRPMQISYDLGTSYASAVAQGQGRYMSCPSCIPSPTSRSGSWRRKTLRGNGMACRCEYEAA